MTELDIDRIAEDAALSTCHMDVNARKPIIREALYAGIRAYVEEQSKAVVPEKLV